VVSADEDDVFIEVHLSALPFWARVKHAFNYVIGRKSKWGDFEEILLDPATALDLGDKLTEWATGGSIAFQPNDVY
jgi:hypothetical protein